MIFECAHCFFGYISFVYVWQDLFEPMPFLLIVLRKSSDAFFTFTPLCCNQCMSLSYALHISPDVQFFIGSRRMRFPSISHNTMMYPLPWLDTAENFSVWSVYMIFFISLMFMHISLDLGCGAWTICLWALLSFSFVYCSPCQCCHMCPFCVLFDCRKYFASAFDVSMGNVAKCCALIAWNYVAFLRNPAAAW